MVSIDKQKAEAIAWHGFCYLVESRNNLLAQFLLLAAKQFLAQRANQPPARRCAHTEGVALRRVVRVIFPLTSRGF